MVAELVDYVVGVDTHRDEHTLALVEAATGAVVAQRTVATDCRGYAQALRFAQQHADAERVWALEGAGPSNMGEVLTMFFGVVLAGALGLEDTGEAIAVPLLATQILWINLLTDGAPALALGMDAPPEDVMRRQPRRLTDRVIDAQMWVGILWVGAVMAVVTLLALDLRLPGGIVGGSGSIAEAQTMAFTTLVLAQLFNCFNARSDHTSAFRRLFTNRWLWGAIALSALLQVAVVQLPFLNDAFHTAPLGLDEWLICLGLASIVLWAAEAKKLIERRLGKKP